MRVAERFRILDSIERVVEEQVDVRVRHPQASELPQVLDMTVIHESGRGDEQRAERELLRDGGTDHVVG